LDDHQTKPTFGSKSWSENQVAILNHIYTLIFYTLDNSSKAIYIYTLKYILSYKIELGTITGKNSQQPKVFQFIPLTMWDFTNYLLLG